ncbi:3-deoxy-D-manno-octulosonic acid transferase [Hydrogenivirga sp.]
MTFCLKKRLLIEKPEAESLSEPLWIHCASVGEFNTFKPVLKELKDRFGVVLTYFSPRAKEYLERQRDLYDLLYPLPLDLPPLIRLFERRISPRALVVVEREFWPSLITSTGVKKILVNAYAKGGFMERLLIPKFSLVITRTEEDRELFEREGAKRVVTCGNLKLVQESSVKPAELSIPKGYRLFVAGSTREGEEKAVLEAFLKVRREVPLKLVLAPRHVKRAGEVEELVRGYGLSVAKRSSLTESWDVLILDTLGELRSFYALADITFVGGTLAPVGGHNLLEPAYLGKPVVFGPHTHKVRDLEGLLLRSGFGFRVESPEEIAEVVLRVLREGFEPRIDLKGYAERVKDCYKTTLLTEL